MHSGCKLLKRHGRPRRMLAWKSRVKNKTINDTDWTVNTSTCNLCFTQLHRGSMPLDPLAIAKRGLRPRVSDPFPHLLLSLVTVPEYHSQILDLPLGGRLCATLKFPDQVSMLQGVLSWNNAWQSIVKPADYASTKTVKGYEMLATSSLDKSTLSLEVEPSFNRAITSLFPFFDVWLEQAAGGFHGNGRQSFSVRSRHCA